MASTADDLSWNTTRCNRLLRPLSTKLAKLRKELERPQSPSDDRRSSAAAFALRASARKPRPRGIEKRKDPDWMPDVAAGANKKTYGGRGAKKPSSRTTSNGLGESRPGAIAFTPLVARTIGRFSDSPQLQVSPSRKHSRYRGPLLAKSNVQELKTQMPAEIEKLVKGMSEAYANLLQATATGNEKRWAGTRSLFGACLRKLPQYIELEEHFAELDKEEEDEEDRDVSQEIYTYLEDRFEISAGQGWRPFKQVVRAHGTQLLCDAFADQILGLETLHLLVVHCLNASAWDEAEKFLGAFMSCLKPLPLPHNLYANLFDEQRSLYMWMIKEFVARTGRYRFLYDTLEYMISQELLPLEWLATESMRPVWDRLVRSLSDGDQRSSANAFQFLETAICAGIGLPDESLFEAGEDEIDTLARQIKPSSRQEFRDALDTTFSSLLTVFCSIALINKQRDELAGELTMQRVVWVADSILVGLLKRNDIQDDLALLGPLEENMQQFAQRAVWAVFASFVVHLEGCQQNPRLLSIDASTAGGAIAWIASQYSSKHIDSSELLATLPAFVSAVARGTGRIWKDDGFDQIQHLVQDMLTISGIRFPHKLWTMKRLALESAMEFAQGTNEPHHMAFAQEVEQSMRTKGHVVIAPTPQKNDSPSAAGGFRWEEGIGEWVTCTPFTKGSIKRVERRPVPVLQLLPSPEASDDDEDNNGRILAETPLSKINSWDALADNDDADIPQSSPIKHFSRRRVSSLGKRTRPSSPKVIVPVIHMATTLPDTVFFSEQDLEDIYDDGPRRSKRPRKELFVVKNKRSSMRSRSSLDGGLRELKRRTYEEVHHLDEDLTGSNDSETDSDQNTSLSSKTSISTEPRPVRRAHSTSSLGRRRKMLTRGASDMDVSSKVFTSDRRRSGRQTVKGVKEWWKVDGGVVSMEGSDDELRC